MVLAFKFSFFQLLPHTHTQCCIILEMLCPFMCIWSENVNGNSDDKIINKSQFNYHRDDMRFLSSLMLMLPRKRKSGLFICISLVFFRYILAKWKSTNKFTNLVLWYVHHRRRRTLPVHHIHHLLLLHCTPSFFYSCPRVVIIMNSSNWVH